MGIQGAKILIHGRAKYIYSVEIPLRPLFRSLIQGKSNKLILIFALHAFINLFINVLKNAVLLIGQVFADFWTKNISLYYHPKPLFCFGINS